MSWTEVKSSNIEQVKLHEGDLHIKFKAGTTYRYFNVSPDKYVELLASESIGKFLNTEIKNKHVYERLL